MNNVRFVSSFDNYEKEISGRKNNTVRLNAKCDREPFKTLRRRVELGIYGTVTIQKGYTKENFTRKVTDVTFWGMVCVVSWKDNRYEQFYNHIKSHFEKEHPDWEVKCKICNKTFEEVTSK